MEPLDPLVERIIREALGQNNTQTLTLQTPETTKWSFLALMVSGMIAFFSLYIAADTKDQARADRIEIMNKIQALESTDNAIRAYINTGRMPTKKDDK